jgi:hypothetical protein
VRRWLTPQTEDHHQYEEIITRTDIGVSEFVSSDVLEIVEHIDSPFSSILILQRNCWESGRALQKSSRVVTMHASDRYLQAAIFMVTELERIR